MVVLASELLEHFCLVGFGLLESTLDLTDETVFGLDLPGIPREVDILAGVLLVIAVLEWVIVIVVGEGSSCVFLKLVEMGFAGVAPVVSQLHRLGHLILGEVSVEDLVIGLHQYFNLK